MSRQQGAALARTPRARPRAAARLAPAWLLACAVAAGCAASDEADAPGTADAAAEVALDDATPALDASDGEAAADDAADEPADAARDEAVAADVGSEAARVEPRFTDVTLQAGIAYQQSSSTCLTGRCWESAAMTGGVAAGDYDGDGWTDLFTTRWDAPSILWRNQRDGTFADVTAAVGLGTDAFANGAAWGDIDGDGDLDLFVTVLGAPRHLLYVSDGAGHFVEDAVARGADMTGERRWGESATFGDYDRDGWLDLWVGEWRPSTLPGVTWPSGVRLLHNRGAAAPGTFEDATAAAGVSVDALSSRGVFAFTASFSDLDDDGWPDLAVSGDFGTSRLFWNRGDGTFVDGTLAAGVGSDENGMGQALADWDGDGRIDWFVSSIYDPGTPCAPSCTWSGSGNRLFRNLGQRAFADVTDAAGVRDGSWGWGAALFDYDHDGDLDLALATGVDFSGTVDAKFEHDPMRFFRNDGGAMTEVADAVGLAARDAEKGLALLDYDRDGDVDLFVVETRGAPHLYRNDGGDSAGAHLRVRLAGRAPNVQGIGARVTVRSGGGATTQVREVLAGNAFLGQSEPVADFGFGASADPVEVVVRWPTSGLSTSYASVPVGGELVATEP